MYMMSSSKKKFNPEGKRNINMVHKLAEIKVVFSKNSEVTSPTESISFITDNTPEQMYEIKENSSPQIAVNTPLKYRTEIINSSKYTDEEKNICSFSEIDNKIAKDCVKSTPDRPKSFSCRRRRNVCYFCSESPKGILRSVPIEYGTLDFYNQRTLSETFDLVDERIPLTETWSNISLCSSNTKEDW
ncbi:hypothetical protein NPIL_368711 [Nephila pilipes]|uniref:Uncharacterized protein n=1 Tax=Nephila pilipes TaxID=299642 RepID=A0A8X6MRT5_NEPPI|nr:hypothetical protein NPIL_368711 [Nephila pilipes]